MKLELIYFLFSVKNENTIYHFYNIKLLYNNNQYKNTGTIKRNKIKLRLLFVDKFGLSRFRT